MIPLLQEIERDVSSWDAMRLRLGHILGIDRPVPHSVLRRARSDDRYAARLMIYRESEDLLNSAFSEPDNWAFQRPSDFEDRSTVVLAGAAIGSLARWLVKGAKFVTNDQHEERLNICRACPHLVDPPAKLIYRVALVRTSDPRICNLCGCVVSRKARFATESCPAKSW